MGAGGKMLTPVAVEAMIGDALGDSTLTLGLWAPERNRYVDTGGAPLELPRDSRARGVTEITRDDHRAAILIHDPALDTDSDLVEGLAATSLMLLEKRAWSMSCGRRARGSCRPPIASAVGSSAIFMTARNSG